MRESRWGIFFLFVTVFGHAMELPKDHKNKLNLSKKLAYSKLYARYCKAQLSTRYSSFFEYAVLEDEWEEADYVLAQKKREDKKYHQIYPALLTLIKKQLPDKVTQLMLRTIPLCQKSYNNSYGELLHKAIITDDIKVVRAVIACIPEDILKKDKDIIGILGAELIFACAKNNIDLAKLLLIYHARPNRRLNEPGYWPLGLAARNRNGPMIDLLLHYEADINIKNDQFNMTVLGVAISNIYNKEYIPEDLVIIEQLLKAGANPNRRSYYVKKNAQLTPLVPAMHFSGYDLRLLKLLLSYGAYARAYPVFEDIVRQPTDEMLHLFINAGIGPNIKNDKQVTFFCNIVKNVINNALYFKMDAQQKERENISNLIKQMLLFGANIKAFDDAKRPAIEHLKDIENGWKCDLSLSTLKADHFFRFTRSFYKRWGKKTQEIRESAIKDKKLPINWDEERCKEQKYYALCYDIAYFIKNYYSRLPEQNYVGAFKNSIDKALIDTTPIITVRASVLQTLLNN